MISNTEFAAAAITVGVMAFGCVIIILVHYANRRQETVRKLDEIATLDRPDVRQWLTDALARNRVVGDADIRDAIVYPLPGPAEPLAILFRNAHAAMIRDGAVNYDLFYAVKKPGQGTGWEYRCAGVMVSDLDEAARKLGA